MYNLAWGTAAAPGTVRTIEVNTEDWMTSETLDWANVEAWAKSNSGHYPNRFGGYNIDCPVPTHEPPSQRLSVWAREDGSVVLNCFGKCEYGDVLEAIAKEIKPSAPPDIEPPAAGEARIKEPEQEPAEAKAQELRAELDTTTAERDQEHDARIATENTAQKLQASVDNLSKDKDKVQDKLDKLRKDYKSVNDKLSRREKRIRKIDAEKYVLEKRLSDAEDKRDQARDDYKELQEKLPVSKSEVISTAWNLLDTDPTAALREAVSILTGKLRQALRDELRQNPSANRPFLIDKALEKCYISKDQRFHLLLINQMRNNAEYERVRFTKLQVRAALACLEQVIDQL